MTHVVSLSQTPKTGLPLAFKRSEAGGHHAHLLVGPLAFTCW